MFRLIALLVLVVVSSSQIIKPKYDRLRTLLPEESNETVVSFVEFAAEYNKTYPTEEEMLNRLKVFKVGVAKANQLNEESKRLGSTAVYGITKFSDMTPEEFRVNYLMPNMPPIPPEKMYPNYLEPKIANISASGPPAIFDWRDHPNAVTGVYNQGQCGSCWAFSATENHESRFALQHHSNIQGMSVQQIIDCDLPTTYGCNGGWPYQAWEYIQSQGGQDALSCYPYAGKYEGCRWNGACNAGGVVSWTWIFPHDEPQTLLWLWGNAPVSICLDASQWPYYKGGVVLGSQCATQTDHCVLLTGWNVNSNPAYWIVRNSWGTDWGYGGYIYLAYNQNTCGMAQYPASCHTCNNC